MTLLSQSDRSDEETAKLNMVGMAIHDFALTTVGDPIDAAHVCMVTAANLLQQVAAVSGLSAGTLFAEMAASLEKDMQETRS